MKKLFENKTERALETSRLARKRSIMGVARSRWTRGAALALIALALLAPNNGCSRQRYRKDADDEVYDLLNTVDETSEKYWEMDGFTLQESGCSRYANLYDPDAQPAPCDDATAGRLLADVEGPRGLKKWTKNGFTQTVENPNWRQTLPAPNENNEIVLDQKVAFDLALLHSPQYRSALENVYLAALNVTAERYAFDVKFYGGSSIFYSRHGDTKTGSSQLDVGTFEGGMSRRFATGADAVVSLANSMVWTFTPDGQSFAPSTTLGYSFTQPFLRGAGRAIVLEDLTRSERRLLANVRQLAFYQQGFYVGVLTGSSPISAPTSGGYPGQGVGGSQTGGFYGLLSSQVRIRNQESNVASTADSYQRYEEYFATSRVTQRTQVDRVRQSWLEAQEQLIELKNGYRDSVESYLIDLGLPPDVENVVVRDPLLDRFNLMPATLETLQNDVARLIAWLRDKDNEIVGTDSRRMISSLEDLRGDSAVRQATVADLREIFQKLDEEFAVGLREAEADVATLEKDVMPRRMEALAAIKDRFERENPNLDSSFAEPKNFADRVATIRQELDRPKEELNEDGVVLKARGAKYDVAKMFELLRLTVLSYSPEDLAQMIQEQRSDSSSSPFSSDVLSLVNDLHMNSELSEPTQFNTDEIEREIAELDAMAEDMDGSVREEYLARRVKLDRSLASLRSGNLQRMDVYRSWFSACLTKLSEQVMTLRLIQARARLEAIELAIVDVDSETAFRVAQERRLDWMNARASLVDDWRNIEIVADKLKSDLSFKVSGSVSNEGSNPVNFSGKNANISTGFQFDAPLDRYLERNSYRQALIAYDQSRRRYYAYVDSVHQQIRSSVRAIELAQISFELQRENVLTSIKRVHSEQLNLTKPPTGSSVVGRISTDAEALTNALNTLLSSQNSIMQTWLQYQSRRMNLMLMLGVFDLDQSGRWIDPGNINGELLQRYLNEVERSQDSLAGLDRLPTFEQLSGGRSLEDVQMMGATQQTQTFDAGFQAGNQGFQAGNQDVLVVGSEAESAQAAPAQEQGPNRFSTIPKDLSSHARPANNSEPTRFSTIPKSSPNDSIRSSAAMSPAFVPAPNGYVAPNGRAIPNAPRAYNAPNAYNAPRTYNAPNAYSAPNAYDAPVIYQIPDEEEATLSVATVFDEQ